MICFTGDVLRRKLLATKALKTYKKRFCYAALEKYINEPNDYRVMSIYGLRRTGKTTMMYQMIYQLNDYDHVCLIQCQSGERMYDLTSVMDDHPDCQYFFIDEITNLENFINTSAVLSDAYASFGTKVILSGTDSLGFNIAKREQLFDRTYMLHTTYISYREYNHLLGRSLDDYIMYGGTLTDGRTNYNKDFYNDYSNSAIVRNLTHTLSHIGQTGDFGELVSVFKNKDVRTFVNKIVEVYNRTFLAETINKRFVSHDIGSLKDLLEQKHININPRLLDNDTLRKELMAELDIQEPLHSIATPGAIEEAKEWLEILDVIYRIPGTIDKMHPEREEVIFTQPGLRYCQLEAIVSELKTSAALASLDAERREQACLLMVNDIKGRMLEDIVYYQMAKDKSLSKVYEVGKYKSPYGEFDITLVSKQTREAFIMEVKHSEEVVKHQTRHLNDQKACADFETQHSTRIIGKAVIYMGETLPQKQYGATYVNAESFLMQTEKLLKQIQNQ